VPPQWIGVGVLCLIGISIVHGATSTRQKDTASWELAGKPSYSVAQNIGLLTITANRADGSRDVTVAFATANGTAVAGTDYAARSGTLVWASGDTSARTISLPISDATPNSIDKTFTVEPSSPTNTVALGAPATATINIIAGTPTAAPAVSVKGNRLIDAAGNVLQLRGVSFSGFESVAIGGWSPTDPSGEPGNPMAPGGRPSKRGMRTPCA
jgi:hypothetical protein